jgi:hypothetical protein
MLVRLITHIFIETYFLNMLAPSPVQSSMRKGVENKGVAS